MSKNDDNKVEYITEEGDEPSRKVKKIKAKLKACEKEKAEYLAGWQRAKADYINLEKRIVQEKSEWIKFANSELILKLLPILDSLEEAIKNSPEDKKKGILQLYNQLLSVLKSNGLEQIKALGEKFNPELHEVIEAIKSDKGEGMVVDEIQKGYKLHGKIIRASKVKVGK